MADYSPSKLTAYMDCPLKYRFGYIDRIKKPDNIAAFVGTTVHATLREVVDARRRYGKELGFDDAALIFDRIWNQKWKDDIVIDKEYLTPDDYKRQGLKYLEEFFRMEEDRARWEVVALEKGCGFDIPETGRTMGGYIDRLERSGKAFRIIDYKCSDYVMSQDRADKDHQLGIYELALRRQYPEIEKVTLEWYYLGAGEVASSSRTAEQREELEREVVRLVQTIESDSEYLPLGNRWCPCEYAEECEGEKERRTIQASMAGRDLAEIVDEYAEICDGQAALKARLKELEAQMEALRPRLEEFCRETGAWSVEGQKRLLAVKKKVDYGIPAKGSEQREELEDLVRRAGLWEQVTDLSKTSVLDALSKGCFGELGDDARCLFEEREKFTFKPRPEGR
jgi:RecB family exonuclease